MLTHLGHPVNFDTLNSPLPPSSQSKEIEKSIMDKPLVSGKEEVLHVFALFAFAVVQPIFELLAKYPMFFIARKSLPIDIRLMVLLLVCLVPALLVLLERLIGCFGRPWRIGMHVCIVGLLVYLIALAPAKIVVATAVFFVTERTEPRYGDELVGFLLSAVLSAGFVVLYVRYQLTRLFISLLSPGILLFPLHFIFFTEIHDLVFPGARPSATLSAKVANPVPVVFFLFDELNGMALLDEHHRIDPVRYPNLARLADEATWFRNATTSDVRTFMAVPSLLSGKTPNHALRPVMADYPQNVFSLLYKSHRFEVRELISQLCGYGSNPLLGVQPLPERIKSLMMDVSVIYGRIVMPVGQSMLLPGVGGRWGNFFNQQATESRNTSVDARIQYHGRVGHFRRYLEKVTASEGPVFYYFHGMLPHVEWEYLPSGRAYPLTGFEYTKTIGLGKTALRRWQDDELATLHCEQRYLLQLGCVDRLVGELLDHLKQVGLYDKCLLVLASDHGASFQPKAMRRRITDANPQDIMPILLMIKTPLQKEGSISDRNVESIDILPTIVDVLDLTGAAPMDGQSALDPSIPERPKKVILNLPDRRNYDGKFEERYRSVERKLKHFGSGSDPHGLFKVGPHPEMIGQQVEAFEVVEQSKMIVRIDNFEEYLPNLCEHHVLIPCLLRGHVRVESETELPVKIAVAIDGTLHAVTRTYLLDGFEETWVAMIPEEALAGDVCSLELFAVQAGVGGTKLAPLDWKSTSLAD
jgi:hypothetical protein